MELRRNVVFIGENLKVMQSVAFEKYREEVGLIYIDPPYNTLGIKSYRDKNSSEEWQEFMRERLEVARGLLREDAAILISIDDNEYAGLKILCDAVFGAENFVGTLISRQAQRSNAKFINTVHEYVLCYAKDKRKLKKFSVLRREIPEQRRLIYRLEKEVLEVFRESGRIGAEKYLRKEIRALYAEGGDAYSWLKNYSSVDERGRVFFGMDLSVPGKPREVDIPEINLHLAPLPTRGWATDAKFIELSRAGRLAFKGERPYAVHFLSESEDNVPSVLNFYSRQGTHDLKRLGLQGVFDTPKPVEMLKFFIRMTGMQNSVILDFFAGSGSLGQAVLETNAEDGRRNTFVLIQMAEKVDKKSTAYVKCCELGVEPSIDKILELRLNRFLEVSGAKGEFEVVRMSEEAGEERLSVLGNFGEKEGARMRIGGLVRTPEKHFL